MESEKLTGWQPSETAPKDGTWILGYWPECAFQDRVTAMQWYSAAFSSPYWLDAADSLDWTKPTHWQPLPAPPGTTRAPADLRSALEAETCCICSGKSFVAVDVQQFDGTYAPGPERRCVECKTTFTAQAFAALAPTKGDVS